MKKVYLALAILGTVAPYAFFAPYMMQNGVALTDFVRMLFANLPASGFTVDLLIASEVFWIWSWFESKTHSIRHWWLFVVLNLTIGLSCALPLFLYFRQRSLEAAHSQATESSQQTLGRLVPERSRATASI